MRICVDCNKKIKGKKSLRCYSCNNIYRASKKIKNFIGKKFNRLTIVDKFKHTKSGTLWKCKCECGNITYVTTHKIMSNHTKSCGCLNKDSLQRYGSKNCGKNNPNWKGGITKKQYYCKICNKSISSASGLRGKGRCSKCYDKTGKNNGRYIDGRSAEKYPLGFTKKLKSIIRKRDNYTCQNCFMTEEEHFKKYNQKLQIHHINHNKTNINLWNLITVCKKCNALANSNRNYWIQKYYSITKPKIVFDIDNTITIKKGNDYTINSLPNKKIINLIKQLFNKGFYIILFTARKSKTSHGNPGIALALSGYNTFKWLKKYKVPFNEIHWSKPDTDTFYFDDKAFGYDELKAINYLQGLLCND